MAGISEQDIIIAAKLRSGKKLTSAEIARLQLRREQEHRPEWVPCSTPHVADIVRWTEPVWAPGETAASAITLGRRRVTAQVLVREADRVSLSVMSEDCLNAPPVVPPLKPGDHLRRKTAQLAAGRCERLSR